MRWTYIEQGSRNKKTGILSKYTVQVDNFRIVDCTCPAREFHSRTPCKHMKRLQEKNNHLKF